MEVEAVMRLYLRIAASATAKAFHLGSGTRELAFASGEGQQDVEASALSMLEHAMTSFVSATACLRIMATPPVHPAHRPPGGGSNL